MAEYFQLHPNPCPRRQFLLGFFRHPEHPQPTPQPHVCRHSRPTQDSSVLMGLGVAAFCFALRISMDVLVRDSSVISHKAQHVQIGMGRQQPSDIKRQAYFYRASKALIQCVHEYDVCVSSNRGIACLPRKPGILLYSPGQVSAVVMHRGRVHELRRRSTFGSTEMVGYM